MNKSFWLGVFAIWIVLMTLFQGRRIDLIRDRLAADQKRIEALLDRAEKQMDQIEARNRP